MRKYEGSPELQFQLWSGEYEALIDAIWAWPKSALRTAMAAGRRISFDEAVRQEAVKAA